MQFHFDNTLECDFEPASGIPQATPAWLTLCLARSLKDWFGQSPRVFCVADSGQLQFGYDVLAAPVLEFSRTFGPLLCRIDGEWPARVYGMADTDELIELSFAQQADAFRVCQRGISGVWCEELRDICVSICLPGPREAACMARLLEAAGRGDAACALGWEHAGFLEAQQLAHVDRTLSFCYVCLEEEPGTTLATTLLAGLGADQKAELWRLFLEKRLPLPEFEWLKEALQNGTVPDPVEWHLALYRTLERLGYRFECSDGRFQLLDSAGQRLYFGVDHAGAAEQCLMKILFPLKQ